MKRQLIAGLLVTACASSIANASAVLDTGIKSNDSVIFNFNGLSEHTKVKLNFDLFTMGSWDGEWDGEGDEEDHSGPDTFGFKIDGDEKGSWTFRNVRQDEGDESNIDGSWITGDFNGHDEWVGIDRHFENYADGFTFTHSGDSVEVEFFGILLQEVSDESWRVNNISLTAVPVPTAVWLFGSGLLGLAGMRRKIS